MLASHCAICGPHSQAELLYPERLPSRALSAARFSARSVFDRVHGRIMRCRDCGLIFADPILNVEELATLYQDSHFTYEAEVQNLRRTYGRYLQTAARFCGAKDRLLEVGCGTGFMLEEAIKHGYHEVFGVEPSVDAIAKARAEIRARILQGVFTAQRFDGGSFDVICGFQVFDHLPDPHAFLMDVCRLLRPGGVLLLILHNCSSWSAKLLGECCPIFDVAHPYLYNPRNLSALLTRHGFIVKDIFRVWNAYSLRYWIRLMPVLDSFKGLLQRLVDRNRVGGVTLTMPAGNFGIIAQHPTGAPVVKSNPVENGSEDR